MAAVSDFLDEVVLGASSADGPVQAWDVRTGMQLKAYKCVPARRRSPVPTGTRFATRRVGPDVNAPPVRWTDPDPSPRRSHPSHVTRTTACGRGGLCRLGEDYLGASRAGSKICRRRRRPS